MDAAVIFPIVAIAVSAGALVGVFYFIYRLFYRAVSVLVAGVDLNLPPTVLLVTFALAATMFTAGATTLWGVVYGLGEALFADLPRTLVQIMYASQACAAPDGSVPTHCVFNIAGNIANSIWGLFGRPIGYLTSVVALVQFFSAWAILAWLVGDLVNPTPPQEATKGIRRLVGDMSPIARLRFGLGTIIVAGAYLCFCAIVAVSLFKPTEKPHGLDQKELEDSLKLAKLSDTSEDNSKPFSARFPESLGTWTATGDRQAMHTQLLEAWTQLRTQVLSEQDRLAQRAVATYKIGNLNRVGSREQANHFLALNKWYQSSLNRLFTQLDNCRGAIVQFRMAPQGPNTGTASTFLPDTSSPKPGGSIDVGAPFGTGAGFRPVPWFDANTTAWNAIRSCQQRELDPNPRATDSADPPERSDFGYTLGVVGELSIWLLRTESVPLALITGLIGFGLFGALVSTFVRAPAGQGAQLDIFGVVWRGVSAAIVVFLAAYSGIAIMSQNSGDPNPFVVFVTCLVGAVFGDDVWLWAKNKFMPKDGGNIPTGAPLQQRGGDNAPKA